MYDNNGDYFGFIYNGTEYYYIKNAQNDVIGLADASGTVLGKYYYDAWGNVTLLTDTNGDYLPPQNREIFEINPIRYRSYYFDSELGFYYLNTRYYMPRAGRFLNADGYVSTGQGMLDKNMFAYCLNNPVNATDKNGDLPFLAIFIPSAIMALAALVVSYFVAATVLAQPSTQQALSNATAKVVDKVSKTASNIKAKVKEKTIVKNKKKDSEKRIHHIVAKGAWRAAPSRDILKKFDIKPLSAPENLVTISQGLHKSMHTKNYYNYVNAKIESSANSRESVEAALAELRADILYAEATGIRKWEIS